MREDLHPVLAQALAKKPSLSSWGNIVRALNQVSADELADVVDWLAPQLRDWPDHFRIMPDSWWEELLDGRALRASLARVRLVGLRKDVDMPPAEVMRIAVHPRALSVLVVEQSDPNRAGGTLEKLDPNDVRAAPEPLLTGSEHGGDIADVLFSFDGTLIAATLRDYSGSAGVWLWDSASLQLLWRHESSAAPSTDAPPSSLSFARGGESIVWADGTRDVRELTRASGEVLATYAHQSPVVAISASSEGNHLASLEAHGALCLWDLQTRALIQRVKLKGGKLRAPWAIAWASDQKAVAFVAGKLVGTAIVNASDDVEVSVNPLGNPTRAYLEGLNWEDSDIMLLSRREKELHACHLQNDAAQHRLAIRAQAATCARGHGIFTVGELHQAPLKRLGTQRIEYGFEALAAEPGEESVGVWWWAPEGQWPSLAGRFTRRSPFQKRVRRAGSLLGAIEQRDFDVVRHFIEEEGASANSPSPNGLRPLMLAVSQCGAARSRKSREVEIVLYLLEHGADPTQTGSQGRTPLLSLLHCGAAPSVETWLINKLLDAGADPYAECDVPPEARLREGYHCVVAAACHGTRALLKRLSEFPPEALQAAARSGRLEAMLLMLDRGADPNAVNHRGLRALDFALGRQQREAVALLLTRGADPNALDGKGESAVHYAIRMGDISALRLLRDHGGNLFAPTGSGQSGVDLAHAELVEWAERDDSYGQERAKDIRGVIEFLETQGT